MIHRFVMVNWLALLFTYAVGQGLVLEGELAYIQCRFSLSKTIKRIVSWPGPSESSRVLTYSTNGSCRWFQATLELFLNNAFRHRVGHV